MQVLWEQHSENDTPLVDSEVKQMMKQEPKLQSHPPENGEMGERYTLMVEEVEEFDRDFDRKNNQDIIVKEKIEKMNEELYGEEKKGIESEFEVQLVIELESDLSQNNVKNLL